MANLILLPLKSLVLCVLVFSCYITTVTSQFDDNFEYEDEYPDLTDDSGNIFKSQEAYDDYQKILDRLAKVDNQLFDLPEEDDSVQNEENEHIEQNYQNDPNELNDTNEQNDQNEQNESNDQDEQHYQKPVMYQDAKELQVEDTRFDQQKNYENADYVIGDENMNGNAPLNDYDPENDDFNADDSKDEPKDDTVLRVDWKSFQNENNDIVNDDAIEEVNQEEVNNDEETDNDIQENFDENSPDENENIIGMAVADNEADNFEKQKYDASDSADNQSQEEQLTNDDYKKLIEEVFGTNNEDNNENNESADDTKIEQENDNNQIEMNEPYQPNVPEEILEETKNILNEESNDDQDVENGGYDEIENILSNLYLSSLNAKLSENKESDSQENYNGNDENQEENFNESDTNDSNDNDFENEKLDMDEMKPDSTDEKNDLDDQLNNNNESDADVIEEQIFDDALNVPHDFDETPNNEEVESVIDVILESEEDNSSFNNLNENDEERVVADQQDGEKPQDEVADDIPSDENISKSIAEELEIINDLEQEEDESSEKTNINRVQVLNDDNSSDSSDESEIQENSEEKQKVILNEFNIFNNNPINITLSLNDTNVIFSPNYPDAYKEVGIIDWFFKGDSETGIEFNLTHFEVDSDNGDYLMIKPGQSDTSGDDGLIFAHSLTQERRYRFLNANEMYVRFENKGGNPQNKAGFIFSIKSVANPSTYPEPSFPEAVAQAPEETLTLYLTGFDQYQEANITSEFLKIIQDMALMYANRERIQDGETANEYSVDLLWVAACNVNWPNSQTCTAITFGVVLKYEDYEYEFSTEQLIDMWTDYSRVDPFALRLRLLGVAEYFAPNDRAILSNWLLASVFVMFIVSAIGWAIFRWNCFQDYNGMTRLKEETDSVASRKSSLNLYPTPHQNLPPMFADEKYEHYLDGEYGLENDTTRVDMGGAFTNKSFVKDGELMDLDSDEEIVMSLPDDGTAPKRQMYDIGIRPRDVYDV